MWYHHCYSKSAMYTYSGTFEHSCKYSCNIHVNGTISNAQAWFSWKSCSTAHFSIQQSSAFNNCIADRNPVGETFPSSASAAWEKVSQTGSLLYTHLKVHDHKHCVLIYWIQFCTPHASGWQLVNYFGSVERARNGSWMYIYHFSSPEYCW